MMVQAGYKKLFTLCSEKERTKKAAFLSLLAELGLYLAEIPGP